MDVLRQVDNCLPKRKHCIQLADRLGLGDEFSNEMKEGMSTSGALDVLRVWRQKKRERANGKVLFESLIAMNKRDIAVRFAAELLGRGKTRPLCVYERRERQREREREKERESMCAFL